MFAMYDDDGLNFRSTIDRLYTVHEVAPSQTIKNKREDNEQSKFKDSFSNITQEAKNKYKQMANIDTVAEVFHVNQIMHHPVITVGGDATIKECYDVMMNEHIQQLPILAHNDTHVKGMITLHDILKHMMEDVESAKYSVEKTVDEIATKKIITTDPISDVRRVAKVMTDFNINAIPVVNDNDVLVGIVSRNDILKAVSNMPHLQIWA